MDLSLRISVIPSLKFGHYKKIHVDRKSEFILLINTTCQITSRYNQFSWGEIRCKQQLASCSERIPYTCLENKKYWPWSPNVDMKKIPMMFCTHVSRGDPNMLFRKLWQLSKGCWKYCEWLRAELSAMHWCKFDTMYFIRLIASVNMMGM